MLEHWKETGVRVRVFGGCQVGFSLHWDGFVVFGGCETFVHLTI